MGRRIGVISMTIVWSLAWSARSDKRVALQGGPSRWAVAGGIPYGAVSLYRRTMACRRRLPASAALPLPGALEARRSAFIERGEGAYSMSRLGVTLWPTGLSYTAARDLGKRAEDTGFD